MANPPLFEVLFAGPFRYPVFPHDGSRSVPHLALSAYLYCPCAAGLMLDRAILVDLRVGGDAVFLHQVVLSEEFPSLGGAG